MKLKKVAECINDGTPGGRWLFAPGYGPPDTARDNRKWWYGFLTACMLQILSASLVGIVLRVMRGDQ